MTARLGAFLSTGTFGLLRSCEMLDSRLHKVESSVADLSSRLIVIPLSFLRKLDSLKYTSVIALISIGYLVVLVVYHFAAGDTMDDRGSIRVFEWASGKATLASFPVIVFAYTCHQNVCLVPSSGLLFMLTYSRCSQS